MKKWLVAHKQHLFVGIFAFAAVSLWIFAMTFSPSYRKCEGERAAQYSQPYKPGTDEKVATFLFCQGGSLDANGELLTAIGTLIIAIFTATLWQTSREQGRMTQESIELARKEFNATHRPKIEIHSVTFEPVVGEDGDFDSSKAAATVIFYNTGPSPAVIQGIKFSIAHRRLPLASGITPHNDKPPKHKIIESGMGDRIELGSEVVRFAPDSTTRTILIGKIFYRGWCGRFETNRFL